MVGPGAIGLYYGGLLARSGVRLQVMARSDYNALRSNGITLRMMDADSVDPQETYTVRPESVELEADSIGPADWIIMATKATANQDILPALKTLVRSEKTVLLTLQNGMGNTELLAKHFPKNPKSAKTNRMCKQVQRTFRWQHTS